MSDTLNRKSNLEKLKRAYETKDFTGFKFWKPIKYGKYTVRFLPPSDNDGLFYKETKQHRIGDNYVFCPKTNNEPCPVCELYKKLYDTGTPEAIALAKEIKGRKQYLYNIVIRDEDGKAPADPKKVHVYMSGKKLFDTLVDYFFDEDYGDLTDVEKGYDFVIRKEKGDLDFPTYDNSKPRRTPSPLADTSNDINEILSNIKNLENEIDVPSYDDLKKMLDKVLSSEKSGTNKSINSATQAAPIAPTKKVPNSDEIDEFEKNLLAQIED